MFFFHDVNSVKPGNKDHWLKTEVTIQYFQLGTLRLVIGTKHSLWLSYKIAVFPFDIKVGILILWKINHLKDPNVANTQQKGLYNINKWPLSFQDLFHFWTFFGEKKLNFIWK